VRDVSPRIGRLHVLTDETVQARWSHADLARAAAEGGADVVQYREKRPRTTQELVATALGVRQLLPASVQLVVDDRVDVAVAVGAQGVHLGRQDLSPAVARRVLGMEGLVGGTANSLDEARRCFAWPLDYLGVGPVFGTLSKANAPPPLGLLTLKRIVAESPFPVIAIGGITPEGVAPVYECGAWGVAVLSAVVCKDDPGAAVARFREVIDSILSQKHVET